VRVEKSRIKVDLLIACRYKLSRPIKDRKASTGFIHENWMWRVTRVTLMSEESFRSSCDLYMFLLELYMCLGFTPVLPRVTVYLSRTVFILF
jgi:hypothetical protein